MGIIVALIVVQNVLDNRLANVSFSYQLEPLVDLDLIQPDESRKTASGANLVTFSGKFRDRLTDEGKKRYRFLSLLNQSHEFESEKKYYVAEIHSLKKKVIDAAELFLKISGQSIPRNGYVVIDDMFDTSDAEYHIIIKNAGIKTFDSIADVERLMQEIPTEQEAKNQPAVLDHAFRSSQILVKNLRSQILGIGNETMKQELRTLDTDMTTVQTADVAKRYAVLETAVKKMQHIVTLLNQPVDYIRLRQLRSVRSYKETLDHITQINQKIDDATAQLEKMRQSLSQVVWFFNNHEISTRALEKQDPEVYHQWFVNAKEQWDAFDRNKGAYFKAPDQPLNKVLEKTFKSEEPSVNYLSLLLSTPVFILLILLYLAFSRQMRGMVGNATDFSKSPARLYPKGSTKITFKDVAGIDDCLEELQEIVEFLKNPKKFTALGGRIPKGVLCVGSPGTGKTLVAKAVAGEADCPFFSISGSDFVEMFVGVGASRIRKMFEEAKKNAPCIIFIDEIDAVGRHRGAGIGGGHDEREQTLNQLLVEMDGFDTTEGVIIIAATNRPDVLDKALLRPGRFDRQVFIPLPDIKGRYEILKVHARKIKLDTSCDLMKIARSTPGCSGADLANLLNEAALLAARNNRLAVTSIELSEARDKILYGKERRNLELDEQEKRTTAYHESGHAVVSAFVKHADPIDKVTIIPRGVSLGATMFTPKKNRVSYWKKELYDQLAVLMGGRAAEQLFLEDVSSGAKQDIERATQIARSMVCEWGMSDVLGTVTLDERSENGQFLGMSGYKEKLYSENTAQQIDKEIRKLLDAGYSRALQIINENKDIVEQMAAALLEFETLDFDDVKLIINRQWDPGEKGNRLKTQEELHKNLAGATTPPPPPPLPTESQDQTRREPEPSPL